MKHGSKNLPDFFSNLSKDNSGYKNKTIKINNFHFGALPLIIADMKTKFLILSPIGLFQDIEDYLLPNWSTNFGISFPDRSFISKSPAGFKSDAEKSRLIAISILQSFPADVHFVLATEDSLNEKCFVRKKSRPFEINKHTSFDSLIDWLAAANYVLEGVVVQQGCFALRGGIVDVFPGTSDNPIRVNFLSEETEIFTFNIDSQLTEKRISSIKIPRIEEIEAGDQSFNEIYQEDIITIKILDEKTIIIGKEKKVDFEVDFPFNPLLLKDYLLLRENPNMIFKTDNHLTTVGFAHSPNSYLIPDWFQKRESPNLSPYSQDPASIIDFNKIEPGDILAHNDYGLCRYLGLKKNDGNGPEFILLEFDDNGMISLSMQMIRKLSFYASSNQPGISLDSLKRSGSWKRKKAGAENHADEIVDKLLMSYAERTSINRKIYQLDPEMEQVFLAGFPYSDTPDQKSVWDEISKDLSARNKPMNRLLCGDVGFGKTEIAIRAAFRSVYNGKQVGVLAPTTILANQLFSAFKARLSKFNISIEMVSRFRSKKEVDASLQNLAEGRLDIIIGTHSILSDRVRFFNLGLLIIDEEQRFGVIQKEKINNLQKNLDVLSMSATPIPRTLHLATSGIRDISTLNTPPVSRHPINTQISFFDIDLIKRTIIHEIRRGGQVFFVHNEVRTILDIRNLLSEHLPMFKIAIAHGQEQTTKLEKTIVDFQDKKIDILVCSSIIETGIDIPNANTIIINKAHRFGLAQLHQIRGRVGRSDKKAVALLLIPKGLSLNRNAHRRLKAIEKHSGLGEGFNIASMDLEIRGAGTIFGYQQSGGVGKVGAELYTRLINNALERKLNPHPKQMLQLDDVSINVFNDGTIPSSYINPTSIRLDFYRRLSLAKNTQAVLDIKHALINRFGEIPKEVMHLIFETNARIRCCELGIEKITLAENILVFGFLSKHVVSKIDIFLSTVNNYFTNYNYKYWYKECSAGKIKIFVSGVSLEDIPSIIDSFFDKLYDAFNIK